MNKQTTTEVTSPQIIPLGGCGEFGMNMTLYRHRNETFVVDAGSRFPTPHQSGVDCIIPSVGELFKVVPEISAYIITHGHEDHIGALPFIYKHWPADIYAPPWAAVLIRRKFESRGMDCSRLTICKDYDSKKFSHSKFTWVPLNHSIPQACAVLIELGETRIFHTGDFKIDPKAIYEEPTDMKYLKGLGKKGIDLLIADSTNANKSGRCPSESIVKNGLKKQLKSSPGLTVLTTFSSNLWRLMTVFELCKNLRKKVFVLGRGLENTLAIAQELRLYTPPKGLLIESSELPNFDRSDIVVIATGCQGERFAGLNRLVSGHIKTLKLQPKDRVIFSSRIIPGNEVPILNIMNQCEKIGCEIISTASSPDIHVSGHGYAQDVQDLVTSLKPQHFLPIHGSFHHLKSNNEAIASVAKKTMQTHLTETGNVFELSNNELKLIDHISLDNWFIDQGSGAQMDYKTLKQRLKIGELGQVIFSGIYDSQTHTWKQDPQIKAIGLAWPKKADSKQWRKNVYEKLALQVGEFLQKNTFHPDKLNEFLRIKLRLRVAELLKKKPEVSCQVFVV